MREAEFVLDAMRKEVVLGIKKETSSLSGTLYSVVDLYFGLLLLLLLLYLLVSPVEYHCARYIEREQKLIMNVVLVRRSGIWCQT